jgi:23S rRNA-/tRNA-specific pseudouridylate synthase
MVHLWWVKEWSSTMRYGRDPRNRLRMAVVDLAHQSGKVAHTSCVCLASHEQFSLMYCQLHTGRTHQIRVHLSAQQHPIFADTLYGAKGTGEGGLKRQALHAFRLSFEHPYGGGEGLFCRLTTRLEPSRAKPRTQLQFEQH